MHKKCR